MMILFNELKKIWTLPSLFILIVVSLIFYTLFLSFNVTTFPNGHPETELVDMATELTTLYGPRLTEENYQAYYETQKQALLLEANSYIEKNSALQEAGIEDYDHLNQLYHEALDGDQKSEAVSSAMQDLLSRKTQFLEFRIESIQYYLKDYYNVGREHRLDNYMSDEVSPSVKQRVDELIDQKAYQNIMSGNVYGNYSDYLSYACVLIVLAQMVLIGPYITRDHASNMLSLQASSKEGRRLIQKQNGAVIISSILLTTIIGGILAYLFPSHYMIPFMNNQLTSFLNFNGSFFWTDMTLKEYVICNVIMVYLMGLASALMAFVLSKSSQRYMILIAKALPIFAVMAFVCRHILFDYRNTANLLYRLSHWVHIENILLALLMMISFGLVARLLVREHQIEY